MACCQPFFPSHRAPVVGYSVVMARTAGPLSRCPCWPSSVSSSECMPHWHSSNGWSGTHGQGHPRVSFFFQGLGTATVLNAAVFKLKCKTYLCYFTSL